MKMESTTPKLTTQLKKKSHRLLNLAMSKTPQGNWQQGASLSEEWQKGWGGYQGYAQTWEKNSHIGVKNGGTGGKTPQKKPRGPFVCKIPLTIVV